MLAVVAQIDGWDPVARAAVAITAASHDDAAVCHLNEQTWWPSLVKLPTLRYDLFDGAFAGKIIAPSSSLSMRIEPWPDFGRYSLAGARIRLWVGELGAAWDAYTLRFDGRLSNQPAIADGQASIEFAVDDSWLDTALLATYAGTTGAEGPAELKGQVKPLAIGRPRYVAGTLIDSVNSVFQVSNGPVVAIEAAMEKLARFGDPVADYATYADLVAATIAPGKWATACAIGMARFGAPPTGQVSFLVSGDNAGGWARLPGAVIRRIAAKAGGAARVAGTTLAALDVARPYPVSVYLDQQTTARDIIQNIAASVNAVVGVSWTGQLFALPIAIGAATMTLAADGSSLPPVEKVEQVEIATPWQKLTVAAERAWTVHALADIAFTATLVDRGRYSAEETYREGNIVDLADGSRWLFQATTPAIGQAPVEGSAYWTNINPPTKAADIAYADGSTVEDFKPAEPGATNSADPDSAFGPDGTIRDQLEQIEQIVGAIEILTGLPKADDLLDAAQSLVDQTQLKAMAQLADQLRSVADKARFDALTHIEGVPNGTVIKRVDTERREGDQLLAESISLVKASAEGTAGQLDAEVLRIDRALIDGDQASALALESVRAQFDTDVDGVKAAAVADVTRLDQAQADAEQATASALQDVRAQFETRSAELDAGVRRLDSAVATGDAAQAASLQEVTASLDGRVNAQATRFDQALVDATQAQAAQISGVRADFNAVVDDQAAHFSADVTRLDNAVASGDRAQTDALTVVQATLMGQGEADRAIADAAVRRLDQAVVDATSASAQTVEQVRAEIEGVDAEVAVQKRAIADVEQSQAYQLSEVRADFNTAIDDKAAQFGADITRLDRSVASSDQAQADALTIVQARLTEQGEAGRALADAAVKRLDQAVTDEQGARAFSLEQVRAEVAGVGAEVQVQKGAIVDLQGRAKAYLLIEVDAGTGRASARFAADDVDGSTIDLVANRLSFANPIDGKPFVALQVVGGNVEVSKDLVLGAGRIIARSATNMLVHGTGFGSAGQFIEWFGPVKSDLSECTEAQAIRYVKTDGSAYSAGIVAEGQLRNQKTTFDYGLSSVAIGPFVTNGKTRKYVVSMSYDASGTRWSAYRDEGPVTATFVLERLKPDGSWDNLGYGQLGNYVYDDGGNGGVAYESEPANYTKSASGTIEITDTTGGTDPIQLRATITAFSAPGVTGMAYRADVVSQVLQVVSYEP